MKILLVVVFRQSSISGVSIKKQIKDLINQIKEFQDLYVLN